MHEVYVKPNDDNTQLIWRYKLHDELVPESDKDDPHMYMWALDEKLYIVDDKRWNNKKYGEPKHTGIMAGMPALSGGRIYIGKGGRSRGIDFSSGHYRPDIYAIAMMYEYIGRIGGNTTAMHWIGSLDDGWTWTEKDCIESDWQNDVHIEGYDAASLEKSCHEVVKSSTWIHSASEMIEESLE